MLCGSDDFSLVIQLLFGSDHFSYLNEVLHVDSLNLGMKNLLGPPVHRPTGPGTAGRVGSGSPPPPAASEPHASATEHLLQLYGTKLLVSL